MTVSRIVFISLITLSLPYATSAYSEEKKCYTLKLVSENLGGASFKYRACVDAARDSYEKCVSSVKEANMKAAIKFSDESITAECRKQYPEK